MRPIKASFLFLYCLAALTAVGTAVSHLWKTSKLYRSETSRIGAAAPRNAGPAASEAAQPS